MVKLMKNYSEIIRLVGCTLKNLKPKFIFALIAGCSILSCLINQNYLYKLNDGNQVLLLMFSYPHSPNLFRIIAWFLPIAVSIVICQAFLETIICEEYYYTRVIKRRNIIISKLIGLLILNIFILIVELTIKISISILVNEYLTISVYKIFTIFLILIVTRYAISIVLLLYSLIFEKVIVIFIVISAFLLTSAFIQLPSVLFFWINALNLLGANLNMICLDLILIAILVFFIIFIENKRDIIPKGDMSKND